MSIFQWKTIQSSKDTVITTERMSSVAGSISAVYDLNINQGAEKVEYFSEPVMLSFPVDSVNVKDPDKVNLYYFNEESKKWIKIGGHYQNGVLTAYTDHFSIFSVFESDENTLDVPRPNDESIKIFPSKTNVDSYYDWTIKFNKTLDSSTINSKNIYVTHNLDKVEGIQVVLNKDKQSVTVKAPDDGYKAGETYVIHINDSILSEIGRALKQTVQMSFTIAGTKFGFQQGDGYEAGAYDKQAVYPTENNWSRQSRFNGPKNPTDETVLQPTIGKDGTIYTSDTSYVEPDKFSAIGPDGKKKWEIDIAAFESVIGKDGMIYASGYSIEGGDFYNNPGIFAIDPSGKLKWSYVQEYENFSAPHSLIIGEDGSIYGLEGGDK